MKCSPWMQSQKRKNELHSFLRQTIQHHSNPTLCPNHQCQKSWSWTVLCRPTRRSRTNTKKKKKRHSFHHRGLEGKVGSQEIPRVTGKFSLGTNWSRAKANRVLSREHTGHSKYYLPTTQETTLHMDITRWSTPKSDWLYSLQPKMKKLHTVRAVFTWPGADCGSDHQLSLQNSGFKLKKAGKTTRPFSDRHSVVSDSLRPHGL